MNFDISDDRRMLAESLGRYLAERYDFAARNRVAYAPPFHDPQKWAELAELGILHALVDEAAGGFGGAGFDITTVFEPLGRALCPEPVLPALMAARLLADAGEDLEPLMSGARRYAVALGELDAPYAPEEIATSAVAEGEEFRLSGRKSVVYGGGAADRILVVARGPSGGLDLFEIAADGCELRAYGMIDGGGAAELFLDATPARRIRTGAEEAIEAALDAGRLALAAEALGAMEALRDLTLDYLKTRRQFGQPIGRFQALQHRMVDLVGEIEQARSITILAASRFGTEARGHYVAMAKNLIGRAGKQVAEECIQMHGGIAMTWESPASHYAKRLVMIDHQLGDTDFHLERVMARIQAPAEAAT